MSLLITSRITVKINYIMYGNKKIITKYIWLKQYIMYRNKKNYHEIYMVETLPFREYIEH